VASFADTSGHAGDERNFEALYETYKSDVQRLASYLLRNATDAEDAAQTVFLNVLRALRQGVTPSDPRAWLLAITRNVCFSRRRALSARPMQVELDQEYASSEPDGEETPSADEIVGALARLLPNQRTALILRDFRGVSRPEIAQLMSVSPVALEALLTRARAAFREELEAGDEPFACAETRELVERQLDGLITVADRHSLRTHLRHCASCSTLARAVRSSRGKVASLLLWPAGLIARLAASFSQAPTAVHVAAAITSTAAVATVAIPVALSPNSASQHVEGRTPPGPVVAAVHHSPAVTPAPSRVQVVSKPAAVKPVARRPVTKAHPQAPVHEIHHAAATKPTHASAPVKTSPAPVTAQPPATATGGIRTPVQQAAASTPTLAAPQRPAITAPSTSTAPRSTSPVVRPSAKPQAKPKPKPSRKAPKKHVRHAPAPAQQMPPSSPPAAGMSPPSGGAVDGAGPGAVIGAATSPAVVPSSTSGAGSSSNDTSSSNNGKSSSSNGDNGNGNSDHHKHKK
jgi:RNA polymerase sigma factor (sigma-70 family)